MDLPGFDVSPAATSICWPFHANVATFEADPLVCPKCSGAMRVIAFIENPDVIKKILSHFGLWNVKRKPRPLANAPPINVFPAYDDSPGPGADDYIIDPEYPAEAYF